MLNLGPHALKVIPFVTKYLSCMEHAILNEFLAHLLSDHVYVSLEETVR